MESRETIMNNILGKESRSFWMGLSIIWIFIYHLFLFCPFSISEIEPRGNYIFTFGSLMQIYRTGYIGVDVFLFLSAFGLSCSYDNNRVRVYYINRIKRIYPLYIVFLMTFYILLVFLLSNPSFKDFRIYIVQCSGLAALKLFKFDIEWFTPALIVLYVLFPLIYKVVKEICNWKTSIIPQLLLLCVSVYVSHIISNVFVDNLAYRIPIFLLGVLTYYNIKNHNWNRLALIYGMSVLLSFATQNEIMHYSLCVPALLFLVSKIDHSSNNRFYRLISGVGKYSFEFYLAQVLTTKYILSAGLIENMYLLYLLIIALTIALSWFFFKSVHLSRMVIENINK